MNKLSVLIVSLAVFLAACSKKNDVNPKGPLTISGTIYPTVVIGNQTWTSVNYNGPGGVNYNGQVNDPVYGKLYSYTEAKSIPLPQGWRLPTQNDFIALIQAAYKTPEGGQSYLLQNLQSINLLSKTSWSLISGTDSTGFNAVAAGYGIGNGFDGLGKMTNILSSSEFVDGEHLSLEIDEYQNAGNQIYVGLGSVIPNESDRGSVRFVKDN